MDAPPGSIEFEESDELERLRRRAYGPDADIAGDAAAQARLFELETDQHPLASPVVRDAAPASERVPQPVGRDRNAEEPIANSEPDGAVPAAPWWRRRRGLAILSVAIAALALDAALVAGLSQLLSDGSTSTPADSSMATTLPVPDGGVQRRAPEDLLPPDGVLAPDYVLAVTSFGVEADEPIDRHGTLDLLGLSADQLWRYEDFRGLNVWAGQSSHGTTCLLVAVPGQGLREGFSADTCSPENFDAIVDLRYSGDPAYFTGAVFDGLPPGGLIRLALKGDHVDVHLFVRAAEPNLSSQG